MKNVRPITLARQLFKAQGLHPSEVKTILNVHRAAQLRRKYFASHIGIAQALVRKCWLIRLPDNSIVLGPLARGLLLACGANLEGGAL